MSLWGSEEETAQEEYEKVQKAGSEAGLVERVLGPGCVSDAYQAGWENGHDNPAPKDDD